MSGRGDLVQFVYQHVREAILDGAYRSNEPLRLSKLSADLGVSPIPIREALRRLESERLVDISPNRGARVSPVLVEEVTDIYRVRILLETEAVRLAVGRLLPAQLDPVERWISEMVECLKAGRLTEAHALHRDIHFAWYGAADSPWLLRLIEIMWDRAERHLRQAPRLRDSADEFGEEHRRVQRAIMTGDPVVAMAAMREDLGRTAELLRAGLVPAETEEREPVASAGPADVAALHP